ncbi:MAG TPA: hypothetical protein VK404_14450 [Spirosoma sp.]|jgi:hypothetical protein|nr:hypothetical protein [Spirosoma sp.]
MSTSSNSRKESTESNAAQQMHNTMGNHPDLAQLNDRSLDNDLPSRVADSSEVDVPGNLADAERLVAETTDETTNRNSGGNSGLPINAEDASTDEDDPIRAYHQSNDSLDNGGQIADADWNRSTHEGAIPATRVNEADGTLGNS